MGGAVPRPIAWTALDAFARRHGIEDDDYTAFVAVMRAMDAAMMAEANKRRPAGSTPSPQPDRPGTRR